MTSKWPLLSFDELQATIEEMAARIGAPSHLLPAYGSSYMDGPQIQLDQHGYNYVFVERGHEFKRESTMQLDELLYLVFNSITFEMACKYELNNRVPDRDFRIMLFAHQEELIGMLSTDWQARLKEHNKTYLS